MTDTTAPDNVVTVMFRWWNEACANNRFTASGFSRYFAAETEFVVNGVLRARSADELAGHFQRIRAITDDVRLCLPPLETFTSDDKVFICYRVEARVGSKTSGEHAMAYAILMDGLIARMEVISREDPAG